MSEPTTTATEPLGSFRDFAIERTFGKPASKVATEPAPSAEPTEPATEKSVETAAAPEPADPKVPKPQAEELTEEELAEIEEPEAESTGQTQPKAPDATAKKSGWRRRGEKLARQERVIEQLRQELAAAKKPAATPAAAPATTESMPAPEPKPEDFQSVDKYYEALIDYRVKQQVEAATAKRGETEKHTVQQTAQEAAHAKVMEGWNKQVEETTANPAYADWRSLVKSVKFPDFLVQPLYELDHGAKVAYFLADNPAELERVAKLTPAKAIVAIGRIDAEFDKPAEPTKPVTPQPIAKKPSEAPIPIRPAGNLSQPHRSDAQKSTADWIRERNLAAGRR